MAMVFCGVDMDITVIGYVVRNVTRLKRQSTWRAVVLTVLRHPGKEIFEQTVVNRAALRVILNRKRERITLKTYLFDDVVCRAPTFDDESGRDLVDRLMM